MTFIF